ncbi:MAG: hypothetical protein WBQ76_10075 [Candidatus Korobacteraceae bacterium]
MVQTVVSLLSIAAGVGIAVWSFRRNRQTEHEQWVRDKELEEWRELISAVASVEDLIPILIDEELDLDALKQAILRVVPYLRNRLFISKELQEIRFGEEWSNELLEFALSDLRNARNSLDYARTHSTTNMTDTKIESAYQELKTAKIEIRNRYGKLQEKLQQTSRKCLRI